MSNVYNMDMTIIKDKKILIMDSLDRELIKMDTAKNLKVREKKTVFSRPVDKAKYKIIGADDLKKNNYKVLVEVTAENGDKNTYTINVKVEEDKETNITTSDDNKDEPKKHFKLEKKHIIIGSIIAGVILILIIIIKFIVNIKDRKLERALDEL